MTIAPGYQVEELLYEGSNSRVYRGRRLEDGLPVILKQMNAYLPSLESRARFQREFALTRKLKLEGIAAAYELESHQGWQVMILEDFGGRSLNHLHIAASLPLGEWLELAIRITECLAQLHAQHVMHKDINPSNIVWNRQTGQVKLIDLGISTELSREQPEIRSPDKLEGSLSYLSPEQTGRMNRAIDYRTDFYSLGVTFYELLTGRLPFIMDDLPGLVHAHIARTPVPADQVNHRIPAPLAAIIAKLMAKTAEDRYQSASGLKADLQTCLRQWNASGNIAMFSLAESDFSGHLQISQKLYGRQQQISVLLDAFERIRNGYAELLLVMGYSGVGKSSLVHEIQRPIVHRRGYFIEGKFEQFKRDVPYASLSQAFKGLIRQILAQEEAAVSEWKAVLLKALGNNAQVIIDVIPDVELLTGPQPAVLQLPAEQGKNRFNQEFRKFVGVFASLSHPLVIFLDDLQWADLPSLQLISSLMRSPNSLYLLLIGAYRDNELTAAHPLPLILKEMGRYGAAIQSVMLSPLSFEEARALISDSLYRDPEQVNDLAEACMAKTQGNPFFLRRFLEVLAQKTMVYFDVTPGLWRWDIDKIRKADITDNVVDLMVQKLRTLPVPVQRILQGAACLGSIFELRNLAKICGLPENETAVLLWDALQEELVLPLDERYKYAVYGVDLHEDAAIPASYCFLHDRVQQAAYMLCEASERAATHLAIGRLWFGSYSENERHGVLFELVNHFNLGRYLLEHEAERESLARLNLDAARRAKASAAYRPALAYLRIAFELTHKEAWIQQYDFMLALHLEAAEAAYLGIDMAQMEFYIDAALGNARNLLDRVKFYQIRIQSCISERKLQEAIEEGLKVLRLLGISFPKYPNKLHLGWSLVQTKLALLRKEMDDLKQLPAMKDPHMLAATEILLKLCSAAVYSAQSHMLLILLKGVRLSLRYGNAPASAFFYAAYGVILSAILGDVEKGIQYGECALSLQHYPDVISCRTMFTVHSAIYPWKYPVYESLEPLRKTYLYALETGDMEFAANAAFLYCSRAFFCGYELNELESDVARYGSAIEQMQQWSSLYQMQALQQGLLRLTGKMKENNFLDHEQQMHSSEAAHDQLLMFVICSSRAILSYIFCDYEDALKNALLSERYAGSAAGFFGATLIYFYGSLARLAVLEDADAIERRLMLRIIAKNQKKLKNWAKHAPSNFLHKWHLVEAQLARRNGDVLAAAHAFDEAIRLAGNSRFVQEEALANELAGEFYLSQGREAVAETYLRQAQHGYYQWGALAKVGDFANRYPQLFRKNEFLKTPTTAGTTEKTTTGKSISRVLDLATVIKASQAISQEIVLEGLLRHLMHVLIENAGAQRGVLLLRKDGQWFVEAEKEESQAEATVLQSIALNESSRDRVRLPLSLIHYVAHTRESVVIQEAAGERLLENDPYVQRYHPCSMLAIPLLHQAEIRGILYLEHNSASGAFTENRLEILNLLASQTAISIENARLYDVLRNLSAHQERIEEQERIRIAREIHDELGGVLTGIKANLSVAIDSAERVEMVPDKRLVEACRLADSAMETVRRVITDLRPSILDQLGIWAALEWYLEQVQERSGLVCEFAMDNAVSEIEIDVERSTALFRIVQEALTNVVRHAGASHAWIRAGIEGGTIRIEVEDDGKGIAADNAYRVGSWGVVGMKERARYFGGDLHIKGKDGHGTVIILYMPMEDGNE